LYAVLGDLGFFSEDHFSTFDHINSILQGHPDRTKTPGVEISTGSLGQGLSAGIGMALGAKLDKKSYRTFVLLGDGELQCGQVWEAAMFAGYNKLANLTAIVDHNKLQLSGWTKDILDIEPLAKKWEAFKWYVTETDGHDFEKLLRTLRELGEKRAGGPALVIAHTTKGKGVSFMENRVEWHAKPMTDEEVARALAELG
jgi:transketolase